MKKIFVQTPYSFDPNSFWRCMGPLSYLEKTSGGDIQIELPMDGTPLRWDRLMKYDCIFMHRPCRPQDLTLLQMARTMNIPVWSDFDDWLFHLPDWNNAKAIYHNQGMQEIMATMIACSDVVTVSTSALLKKFEKINSKTVILPNAYRSDLFTYRTSPLPERDNHFIWRGTNTHDGDILPMAPAFKNLKEKMVFLGGAPYSLTSQLDPLCYESHDPIDLMMYWKKIYDLKSKVWLFPLKNLFFNQCKSNIAWIEAMHAGAICVAPDMPEWRHLGVITYEPDNVESFQQAAEQAMAMDNADVTKHAAQGFEEMKALYDISIVNQCRLAVLNSIFQPSFERNDRDPYYQLTGLWGLSQLKNNTKDEQSV